LFLIFSYLSFNISDCKTTDNPAYLHKGRHVSDQLKGDLERLGEETGPVNMCCGLFADHTTGIVTTIKHSGLIERAIHEKKLDAHLFKSSGPKVLS